MRSVIAFIWFLPRNIVIVILRAYRAIISPLYGDVCRFSPSCSMYALQAYQLRGVVVGTALTLYRLVRCQPFSRGGVDNVPVARQMLFPLHVGRMGFVFVPVKVSSTSA